MSANDLSFDRFDKFYVKIQKIIGPHNIYGVFTN